MARVGRAETVDLIEGRRMLEATGIEKDVDRLLSGQVGSPIKLATLVPDSLVRRSVAGYSRN